MRARDFKERVELFAASRAEDAYGEVVTSFVSLGTFPAAVEVLTGQRALYYQSLGFTHPVKVEVRFIEGDIVKMKWGNFDIVVRSKVRSDHSENPGGRDKGKYLFLEGAYTENQVITTTTTTTLA